MGVSTYCIIWTLWLCATKQVPRGLVYWLPTDGSISDFTSTKVDDFVRDNAEVLGVEALSKYNVGLKYFYGCPTYWRGLKSKTGVKSISADAAVYDELDEADPSQVTQAKQRLSASDLKLTRELSVPTVPDFGINKRFITSDQCHYAFKCKSCSTWNILEENWPNCFKQRATDRADEWYRACKKCENELDVGHGTWVQKYPSNSLRGYQISQLYSPFVSPTEIMDDYHTTQFPGHFSNHVLGLPFLSAEDRVSSDMVLNLCNPMRPMELSSAKPTSMGVDVGALLHVVILSRTRDVLFVGEFKAFEELDPIMLKFNVSNCVIDALPETRKVKEFIARHRWRAWMCYYSDHQRGSYAFNEVERIVSVNRTESMDVGTLEMIRKNITLPQRTHMVEVFAQHVGNVAKVAEEDMTTGDKYFYYKKLGPDHFRHALNYAMIGHSRMASGTAVSIMR